MAMDATVVSAPGKVLVAGGYLVLDPKYSGVVVATSSRFYTVIQSRREETGIIRVRSPQFRSAVWNYSAKVGKHVEVTQTDESVSRNKFVHVALRCTLQVVLEAKGMDHINSVLADGLDITILGDNDFYSQRSKLAELGLPPVQSSLLKIEPFAYTGVLINDVHKTGLGSSAALITSLVTALLVHFSVITPSSLVDSSGEGRLLAHNTSQFVHCLAQGKVGSGFDVSSAVFGSHLYTRFDPAVLEPIMNEYSTTGPFLKTLSPTMGNTAWNYSIVPFQLPPLTRLMLADVDAGSDTPSLVGKVLKWRAAEGEEATAYWNSLADTNNAMAKTLLQLSDLHATDEKSYTATVKSLSKLTATEWLKTSGPESQAMIVKTFVDAHNYSQDSRKRMRIMGERSGVPIEPTEQTELLDACISQPGVVGGGVPGAGGYDAIWLLVLDPSGAEADKLPSEHVQSIWTGWKKLDVSPLLASESFEKGIRLEKLESVQGLEEAMRRV